MILEDKQNWFGIFMTFSTIYYEFPNIQPISNINKIPKKEERTLGPETAQRAWTSGHSSPGWAGAVQRGAGARRRERPGRFGNQPAQLGAANRPSATQQRADPAIPQDGTQRGCWHFAKRSPSSFLFVKLPIALFN